MSTVAGVVVVVRLFVVGQLFLALLCSSLPTAGKATTATAAAPTIATKSSSSSQLTADGDSDKTGDGDDESRLAGLWLDDFDVELSLVSYYPVFADSRFDGQCNA